MKFYTPSEIADLLQVKERTVSDWIRAGKLTASKLGGSKVIRVSDIDLNTFYESNRMGKEGSHEPQEKV